ncbi:DUF6538 domain-containing protein [Rhodobacter sp. CZR27]|uniref:DUF6538 domain-containing protein n=1 Tax=Rhodobacter sp. CZR27 TaxID=2033869 RepID=UPI003741FC52
MAGPRLRGSVWILQDRVPQDVVERHRGTRITVTLGGESQAVTLGVQVKFSLRTSDRRVAMERHREASAQLGEAYAVLRQTDASGPVRLTDRQCSAIAGVYFDQIKARHAEDPGDPDQWDAGNAAARDLGETHEGRERMHGEEATAILVSRGLALIDTDSRERLLSSMHRAFMDAAQRIQKAAEGDFSGMVGGDRRYPKAPCRAAQATGDVEGRSGSVDRGSPVTREGRTLDLHLPTELRRLH